MTTLSPAQTEINSVIALYSNGQIQEALNAVETLIKSYPNDPLLYNISGICYKTIGKLDEAIKLALRRNWLLSRTMLKCIIISALHSKNSVNWMLLLKATRRLLAIKPDYAIACNNLGVTLQELGQLDAAVKSYEKGTHY